MPVFQHKTGFQPGARLLSSSQGGIVNYDQEYLRGDATIRSFAIAFMC